MRLLITGAALSLPLRLHLALHTLCLASALRQAAGACALSVRESGWSLQALQGRRKCAPVGSADGPL